MNDKLKILVIDDDDEMRQALKELLNRNGYAVDLAHNVTDALIKLWTGRYDLALTDIVMPETSGLTLLSMVRTMPVAVDFIVVTGNDSPENRSEAHRLGAKGYIVKPFQLKEVLSLVESVIKNRKERSLS